MKLKNKVLVLAAMMSCGTAVFAADTADLKVIGKISPGACTPAFAGGGTVDYGTIQSASLVAGKVNELGFKAVPFTVSCSATTKIAMALTDGRSGTASSAANTAFGLGAPGSKKTGYYTMTFNSANFTGDGVKAAQAYSTNAGTTWTSGNTSVLNNGSQLVTFTKAGETAPAAFKTFAGSVSLHAYTADPSTLDLTKEIQLDGLSTLTISYL